jgi:DNA polymerase-3 subunit epsilon
MQDFAAIDFETASGNRSSFCSVGVVIVRNGQIVEKNYRLICPEPEWYPPAAFRHFGQIA